MNKVVLTGRIANDLEVRKTQSNKSVLDVSLAVSKDKKNEDGNYMADFIKCILWEQKADYISTYAGKGALIGVSGKLETSTYQAKDGRKINQVYVTADSVEILNYQKKEEKVINHDDSKMFGGQDYGFDDDDLPFM